MSILIVWCVVVFYVLILCKCHDQIHEGLHTPRLYIILLILAFCFGYATAKIDSATTVQVHTEEIQE